MRLSSIRFKVVLWQIFILSLALFIFGIVFYQNLHRKITEDTDSILRSRALGIEQSINTYWGADRFSKKGNVNFIKTAQRWVTDKTIDPDLTDIIVRIFDAQGKLVASSKTIPDRKLQPGILYHVRKGADHWGNGTLEVNGKPVSLRTFTTPVMEYKSVSYIVQVATPLAPMNVVLRNLALSLLLLLPLTAVLTGLSGIFLAQLTLKPVNHMIETIHQIKAENLKLRLKIPDTKDEIEALAKTFNEMIIRLDDAFTSQKQFMGDISHELKTPLSILKGQLEVSLKKMRSPQEYEATMQSSLEEVNHLIGMVENLLTLARFDAKTAALQMEKVDLNLLIKNVLEAVEVLALQKHITIDLNGAHTGDMVGDKNQLKRLVLNILDNAIKYTPDGGKITIDLQQQKEFVQIDIADSGIGIPEVELPHIFDRFYRVDKSRSSAGFGLGLSIAQSIAMAHGGKITARHNFPQGTVFAISLLVNPQPQSIDI